VPGTGSRALSGQNLFVNINESLQGMDILVVNFINIIRAEVARLVFFGLVIHIDTY
jgi:hypothetical protein